MSEINRRVFLGMSGLAVGAAMGRRAGVRAGPGDDHRGMCVIASGNGRRATSRAFEMIRGGADPVDSVVAGVNIVESDPNDMSVGYGGLPNEDGVVQLDASVMHGPTHKAGAVGAIEGIMNPASVALLVLKRTDHVMLVGEGAKRFALAQGFEEVDLLTDKAREAWLRWKGNSNPNDDWLDDSQMDFDPGEGHARHSTGKTPSAYARGSVGGEVGASGSAGPRAYARGSVGSEVGASGSAGPRAYARGSVGSDSRGPIPFTYGTINCSGVDANGDLASVTTTSGLSYKIPGRVGDSPIVGAGMFCDNAVGAAGATGRGEAVIQNCGAFSVVREMENGLSPTRACLAVMQRIADRTKQKRLLNERGEPNFGVTLYALRKDGAYGSAVMRGANMSFAVTTGEGTRLERCASLFG